MLDAGILAHALRKIAENLAEQLAEGNTVTLDGMRYYSVDSRNARAYDSFRKARNVRTSIKSERALENSSVLSLYDSLFL